MNWRVHIDGDGGEVVRSLSRLDWLLVEQSHNGRQTIARPAGRRRLSGIACTIEAVTAAFPFAVGVDGAERLPPEDWFANAEGFAVVAYGDRRLFCFRRREDALHFGRRV